MLQETHLFNPAQLHAWRTEWPGQSFWSFGSAHSRGVGILIRKNVNIKILSFYHDSEGRFISINFSFQDQFFKVANVYLPNESASRKVFINNLSNQLVGKFQVILGGDFNFVEDLVFDKAGGNPQTGDIGAEDFKILKRHLRNLS